MSSFRRNQILLLIFVLLLVVVLALVWRNFPSTDITELWTNPENRSSIILNIISNGIWVALVAILSFFFRHTIFSTLKALIVPSYTEEQRHRIEQERLYLDNLIERFKRDFPWEVEKYAALEAIQEVRRVQTHLWSIQDSKETRTEGNLGTRVDILSFLRREKGPIMVKGDPGTGKTLTVRRFAVDQALMLQRTPGEGKIPIYIFLGLYTGRTHEGEPEPVFDFLQRYMQDEFPYAAFLREHLTEYLLSGRLLLLFDGLNELPSDEYLSRFSKLEEFLRLKYPKNKAIFTCRTLRYTSPAKFTTVAISDLDNNQIKRFIITYLGSKDGENLYRELTTGSGFMLRVCRNPFMLKMLVSGDLSQAIPQTPAQLFEQYVHTRLSAVSHTPTQTAYMLKEIAFAMQKERKFAGVVSYTWLKQQFSHLALDEYLRTAHLAELIDYTQEQNIRFYHQILQEFFAAVALQEEWQAGKNIEPYIIDYRWEETILVCAGITKDPEKFIRELWVPSKNSPEAFWLATKAVGSSGNRVSEAYHLGLLEEARGNLDSEESSSGFPKIILEVDTVKALSYIDDDATIHLLSSIITRSTGWVQEVCIQVLGNSRNDKARPLLRSAVVQLRSLPILLMVAPYFSRREWLEMAASSTVTISWVTNLFWKAMRLLWLLAPGAYLGLLLVGSHIFRLDPLVLLGRAVSITILTQIFTSNMRIVWSIVRSKSVFTTKFKSLQGIARFNIINITLIVSLWIFPLETLAFGGIALHVFTYLLIFGLFFSLLVNIRYPIRMAHLLYSRFARTEIFIVFLVICMYLSISMLPVVWQAPIGWQVHHASSPIEEFLVFLDSFLLYPMLSTALLGVLLFTGVASIVVHVITFMKYWKLKWYQRIFTRKGDARGVQYIVTVALSRREWLHIRMQAFEALRLIDVPVQYIGELDTLLENNTLGDTLTSNFLMRFFGDDLDPDSELERTVYDLLSRAREQERETPSEKYLTALVNRARTRFQMGYYQEALALLNKVVSLDPKHISALQCRGETYLAIERFPEALVDLNQAVALGEQNARIFSRRGEVHRMMQHYPEALTDFNRALTLNKQEAFALGSRGATYREMKRYSEALLDLNQAITLDEKNAWAIGQRGFTYREMKRYSEALLDFNQAITLDEKNAWVIGQRGLTHREMKRYSEALLDLNQAITLDEEEDWIWYQRALLRLLTQDMNAFRTDINHAIKLIEAVLKKDPNNHEVAFYLALCLLVSDQGILVKDNAYKAELMYNKLMSDCLVSEVLQDALDGLSEFLEIEPTHKLGQYIRHKLQDRIDDWAK